MQRPASGLSSGSVRITTGTNRRLRLFAVTQIAASFVLLAGAGALLTTLIALQQTKTGVNLSNVLAVHVPLNFERPPAQTLPLYREAIRKIGELPGVETGGDRHDRAVARSRRVL